VVEQFDHTSSPFRQEYTHMLKSIIAGLFAALVVASLPLMCASIAGGIAGLVVAFLVAERR
jgi:hypothetical protein